MQKGLPEDWKISAHNHHESGPASFLVENLALLPRGRALDVAMGSGRNAIYLAQNGFLVEGIDVSPELVDEARARAGEAGVSVSARVEDLERIPFIEEEIYDLVICFNYLQRSLIPQLKNWMKPGGMVVYETFTIDQPRYGKPHNPDYLLKPNELLHWFMEFYVMRYREGIIDNSRAVAGIIARKLA
ncbi:MAG: class I SAM-dependent methyltransferase [Dehalococcoidia bacterium]